ncbi:metalloendopeptidase [Coemansia javaensis]|uniref:Metalloendopeptidase n=1 Tax=Coemansia javaensis TaxID=2761396 RepID=A0A9W8HB27_9FUNG|nr:metalloendopeptidase [Coemansia javaensis]
MSANAQAPTAVPKGAVVNFALSPSELLSRVEAAVEKQRAVMDAVAQVDAPTFASVIAPLGRAENEAKVDYGVATFLAAVAADEDVRDAASKAEKFDFEVESAMREDVYKVVRAVFTNEEEMAGLDDEDRRLVERMELEFRRTGMLLPPEQRERLRAVKERISDLKIAFGNCIKEDNTEALFTREELDGLPDDYFDGRDTCDVDGVTKYVVAPRYLDYFPIVGRAVRESTRKAAYVFFNTCFSDNVQRLQELVQLRLEEAQLLGYSSHAEYVLEPLMAKTPQAAIDMLNDLHAKLAPFGERELAELQALKRADAEAAGEPYTGVFIWDVSYYARIAEERKHNINSEEVKEYFPLAAVTRGILDIYQEMLGLRIVKVDNPPVWHEDVDMFEVWEADADVFVGHFYLDLHPRDGKYRHAAVWSIRTGYERPDGTREYPVAGMAANFPKPTATAPALLKHGGVITLMHELGHVFHNLCSYTKWKRLHGTRVEWDFVEAPSQMLENWAWEPEALRRFAAHYETGETIPENMLARLIESKNEGTGLSNLGQVAHGLFDLAIHTTTTGDVDVSSKYEEIESRVAMLDRGGTKTFRCARSTHMGGDYSARYYGYLWSEVFSADMFATRFKAEGISNPQVGRDYRREILRPGGTRDAMESIVKFLGRKPTNGAFLKSIGLDE